jgi:hypothetical protein
VTHVIDRNGILRETLVGGQDYNRFEGVIKVYLWGTLGQLRF